MKINLHKVIQERSLDRKHLARVLFPENKHPDMALTRHLSKRNALTEDQIFRLASFADLSIDSLYTDYLFWKASAQGGLVRFTLDNFSAIYNPQTGITKVYCLDKLLATHVLGKANQPLSEYLSEINSIVINKSINNEDHADFS